MKKVFVSFFLVSAIHTGYAQGLDDAKFECRYRFQYINISREEISEDLMILQIGENVSKFFSYYTHFSDSLKSTPEGRSQWRELFLAGHESGSFPYRRTSYYLYKNHPAGKITITDNVQQDYFKYTENYEPQPWQYIDSTRTILGYHAQLASCEFRGRTYFAWFSPEIPLMNGPWKFDGLPGLILEVYDSEQLYAFSLEAIRQTNGDPIEWQPAPSGKFTNTNRKKFLRLLRRSQEDNAGYIKASTGIDFGVGQGTRKELKYDFMEMDYHD